jgi:hypothetical protein
MTRMVFAVLLLMAAAAASADVLLIDEVRQVEKMPLPQNGLNKADVESRFGTPAEKRAAIGDPPISRWDYDDYSVYFEYDLVLYTVLHPGAVVESS